MLFCIYSAHWKLFSYIYMYIYIYIFKLKLNLSHSVVLILCDPMDCSLPGYPVHRILQARILEWVAVSSSRGSSRPRDQTCISCLAGGFFTTVPPGGQSPNVVQIWQDEGIPPFIPSSGGIKGMGYKVRKPWIWIWTPLRSSREILGRSLRLSVVTLLIK